MLAFFKPLARFFSPSKPSYDNWEFIKHYGQAPASRSGHEVVVEGGKAYLFGGCGLNSPFGDFFSYDFKTGVWKSIRTSENSPSPRSSFGMCVGNDNSIYVWGGTFDNLKSCDQHLYQFDIHSGLWTKIQTFNNEVLTIAYFGRSANCYNGKLYFFGGGALGGGFTNEVVVLDLKTKRWAKAQTTGSSPSPRCKHRTCLVGGQLFVFGGVDRLPPKARMDIFVLCLDTLVWRSVKTVGQIPEGRTGHTCEYDPSSNAVYLWGGYTQTMLFCPFDLFKLDLKTFEWTMKKAFDSKFFRCFHSSSIYSGTLYSFGGSNGTECFGDILQFHIYHTPPRLVQLAAESCKKKSRKTPRYDLLPPELQHKTQQRRRCNLKNIFRGCNISSKIRESRSNV